MNNKIFKALGNKHRLKIVEIIKDNEICACMILEKLDLSQPTLSHHMKILEDVNLVISRQEGKWRHYSLNNETLEKLSNYFVSLIDQNKTTSICDCKGE